MQTGLLKRDGRYSIKRRVPTKLLPAYGGKQMIVRALGTSDHREAKRLVVLRWAELDREFAAVETAMADAAQKQGPAPAQPSAAWQALSPKERAARETAEQEYMVGLAALETRLAFHDDEEDEQTERDRALVDNARLRWEREQREERDAAASERRIRRAAAGDILLSAVADKWEAEQQPGKRGAQTVRKTVEHFEAVNGKLMVQAVTKQHVLAFKDALVEQGTTAPTANIKIGWIGTLLIFARDKLHLIETNPATNIRLTDKRRDKEKRRAFEETELKAIFESPVYTDALRPDAGGGEAAYWLPLLSLYTGARQTELGQLHPDDVMQEAYWDASGEEHTAWVLRFVENAARGQTVKNEGSERRVPIHADLIELGFVTLAQRALAAGQSRIFPEIVPDSSGTLMGNWSKWFGRYRRKVCGLTGKDTPFHSFRHTFKHFARLARIPNEVHNEFTGHETGDVADSYGGLSYPLHPLVEGMKLYRVPGFTLPAPPPGLKP